MPVTVSYWRTREPDVPHDGPVVRERIAARRLGVGDDERNVADGELLGGREEASRTSGYCVMLLTTHARSKTSVEKPARCAEMAAARPHGPAPTMTTSTARSSTGSGPPDGSPIATPRVSAR